MAMLYSIAQVMEATSGRAENIADRPVGSISIDSREILPGALFVAIKGENFDGHDFVAKAIEAGAVAALVSETHAAALSGLPLIVVPDALEGLNRLARFARQRSNAKIVAVTGSVGKTSTKEAVRAVLASAGRTHASIRSFNNQWGVPLMLARMPADTEFGVFELGMSAAGEIEPLSKLVQPHCAVITTIAPAHIEFFASIDGIADAKAEIFAGLQPGGLAILNCDHAQIERLLGHAQKAGAQVLTYGFAEKANARIVGFTSDATGARASLMGDGLEVNLNLSTTGRHAIANSAAAILVARAFGIAPEKAALALARHEAPEGRGATYRLGTDDQTLVLLDESYNANPVSMRAALEVFAAISKDAQRRVLVLGEMRELGAASQQFHAELAPDVIDAAPDLVFLVGEHMKALAECLPPQLQVERFETTDAGADRIVDALAFGDSVMIKGSNGVRLGTLVARIRTHFGA